MGDNSAESYTGEGCETLNVKHGLVLNAKKIRDGDGG
jgi:hypothetical protein